MPSFPVFNLVIEQKDKEVTFCYTNWKGVTRQRTALLYRLYWGSNEWHKEPQWLVDGFDTEARADRSFAQKDMSNIRFTDRFSGATDDQPAQ
jgi:predicted DNA-binding transcriptional regulator YafY